MFWFRCAARVLTLDFLVSRRTVERVMRFVMESHPRHAKFAARLIACMRNAEELCAQVVDVSAPL